MCSPEVPEEIQKAKKAIEKKWKKHAVTGKHFLAVGFTVQKVPDTMLSDKERTTIDDNMASNNVCQVPFIDEKDVAFIPECDYTYV